MKCLVCSQVTDADFFGLKAFRQSLDRRHRTADDLVGTVVDGDTQLRAARRRVVLLNRRRHPVLRGEHGRHRAQLGNRSQQSAAPGHEAQAVFQAEHPCRLRRRVLSEAMADDDARFDPDAAPQRGEAALQRVDGGLRPRGVVQVTLGAVVAEHHVRQRGAAVRFHDGLASVENRPKHRLPLVKRLAHARPLAALAGVDERHLPRRSRLCAVAAACKPLQSGAQRLGILEDHSRAVRQMAAPNARRPSQVGKRDARGARRRNQRLFVEPLEIAFRELPQRLVGFT